jgi:hypothetical protein
MVRTITVRRALLGIAIAFAFAFAFAAAPARAEGTIHVVIACDTSEEANLGSAVIADGDNIREVFVENVPASRLHLSSLPQDQVSPEGVVAALASLPVRPEDTVVFYFSGHGAYDTQVGHYLDLLSRGNLPRAEIRNAIAGLHPRLGVILTDCCYAFKQAKSPIAREPKLPPPAIAPLFDSLFVQPSGTVDITSSSQGEVSMTRGDVNGSLFTFPLTRFLRLNAGRRLGWPEVFNAIKTQVAADFSKLYPKGVDFDSNGQIDQNSQTALAFSLGVAGPIPRPPIGNRPPAFGARGQDNGGDGLKITQVIPGSPAARTGFEVGDVILEINDQPLHNEADYDRAVDEAAGIMRVKVRNRQDGSILDISVRLNH